ncbi:MAG TPA: hypothetical protein VFU81_10920 [Thermomicrobiales bacterium]|nr:hypothetical protein [Thermomicrobiales bacterium]
MALALTAAAALYVWPRTLDFDRIVTVDEPVFLGMSANFFDALVHGQFARTDQFLYPGVPIMWAGAAGFLAALPNYPRAHPDQIEPTLDYVLTTVDGPIRQAGGDPLAVLIAARQAKIALQTAVFLIALWLLRRLFGVAVAALAAVFISFDPFLVSHDQLLHVDGVTGVAAFAAMLAIADADRAETPPSRWALAGALAALCWLTRLTGLVLLPIMLLAIAWGALGRFRQGAQTANAAARAAVRSASAAVGASGATTIALWPALWVDPVGTVQSTLAAWLQAASTPHPWGLYFAGRTVMGDPGVLFYAVVFLYKITPFTLIGLALVALGVLVRRDAIAPDRSWRPIVILAAFVLVYSAGMAIGMRKFDRYILPDFPFFDLLAAIGVVGAARLLWARRQTGWRAAAAATVAALVVGQATLALAQRPYPLAYDNPLFGGAPAAAKILMLGWGEGLDQAARFILAQPGGDEAVVRTSIQPTTLDYFLPPTVKTASLLLPPSAASGQAWRETDYAVTHILEWNRDSFGGVLPYLARFRPVYTVRIDGVDFVRVYDLRQIPPPPWMADRGEIARREPGAVSLS